MNKSAVKLRVVRVIWGGDPLCRFAAHFVLLILYFVLFLNGNGQPTTANKVHSALWLLGLVFSSTWLPISESVQIALGKELTEGSDAMDIGDT